jgi:tripartite-type tricarboxylate transporter receptor subunit TctC
VQAGKLRALAVTGAQRSQALPNVPTVAEAGLPGYEATTWFGLFAPARTPPAIIDKLNKAVNQALSKPEVIAEITKMGSEPMHMTPDEFRKLIASDTQKWRKVVKTANVKVD